MCRKVERWFDGREVAYIAKGIPVSLETNKQTKIFSQC